MYFNFKISKDTLRISDKSIVIFTLISFLLATSIIKAADYSTSSVIMNATVSNVVQINISSALQRGVLFGSLTANTNNNMAENDTTGSGNTTDYWIGVDPSTTGTLDLWHYAADMDREGNPDVIGIGNVTHEANTTQGNNVNMTLTSDGSVQLSVDWSKLGGVTENPCNDLAIGSVCYEAYWLDVPANIPVGTYNTTYNYCGNLSAGSTSCDG